MKFLALAFLFAAVCADDSHGGTAADPGAGTPVAMELDRLVVLLADGVLRELVCRLAHENYTPTTLSSALYEPVDQIMRRVEILRLWGLVRLIERDTGITTVEAAPGKGAKILQRWALRYCSLDADCGDPHPGRKIEKGRKTIRAVRRGPDNIVGRFNEHERPILLFDGVCQLCSRTVGFVVKHDSRKRFRFVPLQSPVAESLLGPQFSKDGSMVLVLGKRNFHKSTAALKTAKRLDGLWPLLSIFLVVPEPLRDAVYDWLASRRYRLFGKREKCWVPEGDIADRFLDSELQDWCDD